MASTINMWIARAFAVLGLVLVAFGLVMGSFGWANSGFRAGIGLYFVSGILATGAAVSALLFRLIAGLHAVSHPRRWLAQLGSIVALYLIFGLAAEATTLLDETG